MQIKICYVFQFLRPQCHLDIAENNYILHMYFPIFDLSKKPHIFINEQGLHFCDEQKLDFPFGGKKYKFHRIHKLPSNQGCQMYFFKRFVLFFDFGVLFVIFSTKS
jgi:hypothetical protein